MPPSTCAAGGVVTVALALGFLVGLVTGSGPAAWAAGAAGALALLVAGRVRRRSAASCGTGCAPWAVEPAEAAREDQPA